MGRAAQGRVEKDEGGGNKEEGSDEVEDKSDKVDKDIEEEDEDSSEGIVVLLGLVFSLLVSFASVLAGGLVFM